MGQKRRRVSGVAQGVGDAGDRKQLGREPVAGPGQPGRVIDAVRAMEAVEGNGDEIALQFETAEDSDPALALSPKVRKAPGEMVGQGRGLVLAAQVEAVFPERVQGQEAVEEASVGHVATHDPARLDKGIKARPYLEIARLHLQDKPQNPGLVKSSTASARRLRP